MQDVVILAQGNELTTGAVTDTNSSWLASALWAMGLRVRRMVVAPDHLEDLTSLLTEAAQLAAVVISTGGLGPTRDDLTAEAAARAFGRPLALDPTALAQVEARFARWGRVMAESNRKQAVLPTGSELLENHWGTAPGFSVDTGRSLLFFLPGVPREMRELFRAHVAPAILARFDLTPPALHTIRTVGIGESELETRLQDLRFDGLEVGFRSTFPENHIKLLFGPDIPKAIRKSTISEVLERVGDRAFGVDSGDLAEVIAARLVARGHTLALAESCTGCRLAGWLTDAPGASRFLIEGAVVYSNDAKVRTCGVSEQDIAAHGAVSECVAKQLATGIRSRAGTTWGVGITGVAGPGGATETKPLGRVHVSVAGPGEVSHREYTFRGGRERVRTYAMVAALRQLLRAITAWENA
ncbi:MAG: CinA family nicotinamide mononucleotide deamidase-related protein [Myxococcota bacterium]|nr:CinA family nicotinamide mononucleotide deamidase-related protein [Myxococcota bacterium]